MNNNRPHGDGHSDEQAMEAFQQRHRTFANRVERFVLRTVIVFLVGLVLVQTLEMIPAFRRVASLVEGLEGIPWGQVTAWNGKAGAATAIGSVSITDGRALTAPSAQTPAITIVLANQRTAPDVKLLVDGQVVGTFASSVVTVPVRMGQSVVLDGSATATAVTFRVVGAVGLSAPGIGATVTTRGDKRSLGKVAFRRS